MAAIMVALDIEFDVRASLGLLTGGLAGNAGTVSYRSSAMPQVALHASSPRSCWYCRGSSAVYGAVVRIHSSNSAASSSVLTSLYDGFRGLKRF